MPGTKYRKHRERINRKLPARLRKERRFRLYGLSAIVLSLLFLAVLLGSIISHGYSAFLRTEIRLDVTLTPELLDVNNLARANYGQLIHRAAVKLFPQTEDPRQHRQMAHLVSTGAAFQLQHLVMARPELIGTTQTLWMPADDTVDMLMKGQIARSLPESERRVSDQEIRFIDQLKSGGRLRTTFNTSFFTAGDSPEPELAGLRGALMGSFYSMLVTLVLSFPIGVAAAIYLEEFAPKNRWTNLVEININNLAAVPSLLFGLLGLAVFLNTLHLPRSSPLVAGLVLTLMTLPSIILTSRASLRAVPSSIREAALSLGASKMQIIGNQLLPQALPDMLTGALFGIARALGETAPLMMIGMVAFIGDPPRAVTDPATVLPVQIYLWADLPEESFIEHTAAAILILLALLLFLNATAVILRDRFGNR